MRTRSRRLLRLAQNKGAALIIVLAFVVLLTGVVLAYFSRTTTDRQLAQASFNDTDADLLARSALDIVVGDFKQEIVDGSGPPPSGIAFYSPAPAANVLPMRSGNPAVTGDEYPYDLIPNLTRRSIRLDPILPPGIPSRASAVNSTDDVSANGRSISRARWNSHYLIPRDPSATGDDPMPIADFVAPDWVIVTRAGPAPFTAWNSALADATSTNTSYAVGRYAYAVYDEGGLLDINVAGFPTPTSNPVAWVTDVGRKGVLAFADLTTLPTTPGNFMSTTAINKFIFFRNYATTAPWGTTLGGTPLFSPSVAALFGVYYLGPVGATASIHIGTSQDFGTVRPFSTPTSGGPLSRTDQNFITRAELINFRRSTDIASVNTLQYLGTFSREKNAPTWRAGGTTTTQIEGAIGPFPNPGRFYMGNLNTALPDPSGVTGDLIQEFSLHWHKGKANPPPASPGYWSFKGPTNPNAWDHIPALAGPTGRFAGLLNYAMNDTASDDYIHIGPTLSIVASLIDQYDLSTAKDPISLSTTTVIAYNSVGSLGDGNVYVYGVEANPPDPNISKVAPSPAVPPAAPPTPIPAPSPPGTYALNRPFRSVGDLGDVIKSYVPGPTGFPTLDFYTATSTDAPVLDLFTYNSAPIRSGIVSLNTRQPPVLAAILRRAITTDATSAIVNATNSDAINAAITIVNAANKAGGVAPYGAALSRADIVRLASLVNTAPFGVGVTEEVREAIPRALGEVVQTRTWGLLIDIVAQTGHYPPNATSLPQFVVDGEKRYWLHVAIDRWDGTVVGQQLEEVLE